MSIRDKEKYYWLKLDRHFFKRHDIRIIEDMPDGKEYVLFYLKLMVEAIDHEGALRFSDTVPYSESMLSSVTNTSIEIVQSALELFLKLGIVEVMDDKTLFLREVAKLLDCETFAAKRQRELREKEAGRHCRPNVAQRKIQIKIKSQIQIQILLQNLKVLYVGQKMSDASRKPGMNSD